jgi:DNA modification methylase
MKAHSSRRLQRLQEELQAFAEYGTKTVVSEHLTLGHEPLPVYINEFWTAKQRAAHSLHEVSYRACFKPQLPRFFIERLTAPGDVVYDPFMGRGTTVIEAALLDRVPWGCDVNPLSQLLVKPRLNPPTVAQLEEHTAALPLQGACESPPPELLAFYHPEVLSSLQSLKEHFRHNEDIVDGWLRMVATNRLTGHSNGFFSVYSLPPNQAVSVASQQRINEKRHQVPPPRDLKAILKKKSLQLLKDLTAAERKRLSQRSPEARLLTGSCDNTPALPDNSVHLVVTSPPFLTEVDYKTDNWLRCWFNEIDLQQVHIAMLRKPSAWQAKMTDVLKELHRILVPGGFVAFEVGEVVGGKIALEDLVIPAAREARLVPKLVMINAQVFTKTSNCWGVDNLSKGTNSNRIVLLQKPASTAS